MRYVLLFIFSCYLKQAYCQDTLFRDLKEVVVTGQLTEKSTEDAVHKVRVISGKELNSGLFTDLGQVLDKELNIKLSQDNVLGSSISIQGMSGQNVKILIDEIPVIGRLNGNIDLSQISLNNIERIEIIEGPLSTLYGTDALAGTINIITNKNPSFKKIFNTYYETVGRYNFDFMLSNNQNHKTINYEFARNYFNGWSENQKFKIIPTEELADENRFKQWKPKEQFINKIQYNLQRKNLKIYNYVESFCEKITNLGLPRGPYSENAFDEYYHTYRTNIGSNIDLINDQRRIKILLAYNSYVREKETFYKDLTTLSSILVQDPSSQDTSSFNLMLAKVIMSTGYNNNLEYQIGIEAQSETARGDRISNTSQVKSDYALFSTMEYNLNNIITLRPSARFIYNTKYKAPFIPAFNMLINLNQYKFRLGLAQGYRAPSLKELYMEFIDINHNIVGNGDLLAEESSNYHINNSYTYANSNVVLKTEVNLFYNAITNKIDLTNSTTNDNQYSYFNVEEYKTKGLSTNFRILIEDAEVNLGLAHTGRYNKLSNSENITKFNFSTDYSLSTVINFGSKTKLNMFYKNVGRLPSFWMDEDNIVESYTDAYSLLDLSVNRRISESFILSMGGRNLLNIKNIKRTNDLGEVHSSSNNNVPIGYGRTFFMSLKFKL